ncbi:unnamed protein product [Mytilus coruscus]|uniref:Tyr recombinase domain-containing protein n=1 Tax=Mytilus coruscus TaxID=42192 RepID=A0A6J8E7C1_MYTCO|nr:unnamed protein product [Mytilus coruscus]
MLGLQQTVIKLININDRPIPVDANNLSTAYAAMRSNDPGPSTSSGSWRRIELDRYEANIIDIYNVYGAKFYDYHCQFSARAAAALRDCNIKVDWSIKDTTMLSMVAGNAKVNSCSNCSSTMHLSSFCPQLQNIGTNKVANTANYSKSSNFAVKDVDRYGRKRVTHNETELCNNFNDRRFKCLELNIDYPDLTKLRRLKAILNGVKRIIKTKPKPRCGEFTVDSCGNFDPAFNLCISDITILSDSIHLKLKISKTDPFRQGLTIKLFETGTEICPYRICCLYMNNHFQRNPSPETPLFVDLTGAAVTRAKFLSLFKHALDSLGIDSTYYSGHSFSHRGSDNCRSVQVEDHLIKVMGRWSSDAYCRYIKISESDLKRAQNSLAKN